jgi:ligand of Numb protein X 3/4
VNGQDVSNSSHEDAVRCFQSAQEPIIVEVLRRQPSGHQQIPHTPSKEHERIACHDKSEGTTNGRCPIEERTYNDDVKKDATCPLVSTAVQTDWAGLMEEEELLPVPLVEEQANDSFEDFLAHDIDFEVIGDRDTIGLAFRWKRLGDRDDYIRKLMLIILITFL